MLFFWFNYRDEQQFKNQLNRNANRSSLRSAKPFMPASVLICPGCKKRIRVPAKLIGKWITCPGCRIGFGAMPDVVTGDEFVNSPPGRTSTISRVGLIAVCLLGMIAITTSTVLIIRNVKIRHESRPGSPLAPYPGSTHQEFDPSNFEKTLAWAKWQQESFYVAKDQVKGNEIMQKETLQKANESLRHLLNQRIFWAIPVTGVSMKTVDVVDRYIRSNKEAERNGNNFSIYLHILLLKPGEQEVNKLEDDRVFLMSLGKLELGTQISVNDAKKLKEGDKVPVQAIIAEIGLTDGNNTVEVVLKDVQARLP